MKSKEVKLIDLKQNIDDRGYLYEVIHSYDLPNKERHIKEHDDGTTSVVSLGRAFGQVYVVGDFQRGTIRGFHRHKILWDYFHIVKGSAKFILVSEENDVFEQSTYVLTDRQPQLLVVPPGIYHGWMNLEDETILISTASELYNKQAPDEERLPYTAFNDKFGDDLWKVEYK